MPSNVQSRELLRTVLISCRSGFSGKTAKENIWGQCAVYFGLGRRKPSRQTDQDMPWRGAQADFFQSCDRRVMDSGLPNSTSSNRLPKVTERNAG